MDLLAPIRRAVGGRRAGNSWSGTVSSMRFNGYEVQMDDQPFDDLGILPLSMPLLTPEGKRIIVVHSNIRTALPDAVLYTLNHEIGHIELGHLGGPSILDRLGGLSAEDLRNAALCESLADYAATGAVGYERSLRAIRWMYKRFRKEYGESLRRRFDPLERP